MPSELPMRRRVTGSDFTVITMLLQLIDDVKSCSVAQVQFNRVFSTSASEKVESCINDGNRPIASRNGGYREARSVGTTEEMNNYEVGGMQ